MKCIVGLGNPGEKYQSNRHNAGFMVVDDLAKKLELNFNNNSKFESEIAYNDRVILVKPQTFMNDSGKAVAAVKRFYKIELNDLYIVHDDLDIPLGKYKIQHGKGPQVHNGLLSVEQLLGSDKFWNVRVGVENREVRGNKGIPGTVYSLQDFKDEERGIIGSVIQQISRELELVLQSQIS